MALKSCIHRDDGLRLHDQRGSWRIIPAIVLLYAVLLPVLATSQGLAMENPNKVKAAFLRNFAHYVTWPNNVFPNSSSPWHIGILGQDPFGDVLETTLEGRTEQGRGFEVFRADRLDELPSCQIIFLAYNDVAERRAALVVLKDKPVLTVGDAPEFLREGGVIQFQVGDRVQMSINLDQSRAVSLAIQTKMLEVSRAVLENGVMGQVR
ncbi:YfiR family protein [Methyloglobulus morosus]|nr:YfiR family protein [Methyloglobulus morosus]